MAHLYRKTLKGRTYWYLRETERVAGKVKVKWQKYLGTPDTILERLEGAAESGGIIILRTESFGAIFLADLIERRLGIVELIDQVVPRDKREKGPTVGEYFFYAWANRMIAPRSKRALETWYKKKALSLVRPADTAQLTSQRYWEKWSRVDAQAVEKIGTAFLARVWQDQPAPPDCVLFDTTNYYTYMASETESELAKRGHNKDYRHHLRQVGLALLVDRERQLPLYYRVYSGNEHDSKVFKNLIDEMFGVLMGFGATKQRLTVVFDKGMNSAENIAHFDDNAQIHFITTYSPYFADDLGGLDIKHFSPIDIKTNRRLTAKGKETDRIMAWRTVAEFWGKERTVVVTHNPRTQRKRRYTFDKKIEQLRESLLDFRRRYREQQPHWRDPKAIEQRYIRLCEMLHIGTQYYKLDFGDLRRIPDLSIRKDHYEIQKTTQIFGRNIIITDNADWTTEEIVQRSLDRGVIERQFRESKAKRHITVNPMFHWTDGKLRCHLLTCVIALTCQRLIELEMKEKYSAATIIEAMDELNCATIWRRGAAKPEIRIEEPSDLQSEILEAFGYRYENGQVLRA